MTDHKTKNKKIKIDFIVNKTKRRLTYNTRRVGLMKKSYELSLITGVNILLLISSINDDYVYFFSSPKLRNFVNCNEGQKLIRKCLQEESPKAIETKKHHLEMCRFCNWRFKIRNH
ncbi:hypothetical protein TPHA_0C02540 [Tetrapisispora phaffii CBS 4417]|uniref:MADS-box domain-containing protein n=1 Tax=Tetrapisispora phaffii (strain ATCC 24235 / CBS 4417 / NBRC 1672 / NRRL Y-8282 / UCD 70-5) TaxID=1071381 RepID=G8BRN1_TETPH|nr:hypothetical protein TPHA_0C02540 [Tetrapisispora phaffii CBS 4417]CCE62407.1 hypothetical protein TPHA_0C02540 [Tetrapisispora phaffii CBS 4417]